MWRVLAAIVLWLGLTNGALAEAAAGGPSPPVQAGPASPPPQADPKAARKDDGAKPPLRLLVIKPDVQLSLLTASGVPEPRADWSNDAVGFIIQDLKAIYTGRRITQVDPVDAMSGRGGQLMRLNEAVLASMVLFTGPLQLPTKADKLDWTIGDGAKVLADQYGADYALLIVDRGSYASSGRVATMLVMAAVGVGVTLGQQQAEASLVDLRTGKVVWFNQIAGGDLRNPDTAMDAVGRLMKDAPL